MTKERRAKGQSFEDCANENYEDRDGVRWSRMSGKKNQSEPNVCRGRMKPMKAPINPRLVARVSSALIPFRISRAAAATKSTTALKALRTAPINVPPSRSQADAGDCFASVCIMTPTAKTSEINIGSLSEDLKRD